MPTHRTIRLSYRDGLLCGVCGGIADHFGCKPWLVRTLYVVLSIASAAFPGLLVYLLLYLVMPGPELRRATSHRAGA